MNELENSEDEHRNLGKFVNDLGLDQVILVGEKIKPVLDSNPDAIHFHDVNKVSDLEFPQNSIVLLKASRSKIFFSWWAEMSSS